MPVPDINNGVREMMVPYSFIYFLFIVAETHDSARWTNCYEGAGHEAFCACSGCSVYEGELEGLLGGAYGADDCVVGFDDGSEIFDATRDVTDYDFESADREGLDRGFCG